VGFKIEYKEDHLRKSSEVERGIDSFVDFVGSGEVNKRGKWGRRDGVQWTS